MNSRPISFPQWKAALEQSPLSAPLKTAYAREILTFLRHCKISHVAATVEWAREYLAWREKQAAGPAREVLRWFYRQGAGKAASAVTAPDSEPAPRANPAAPSTPPPPALPPRLSRSAEPPDAASDLGAVPRERDLIRAIRERNFLWRSEQPGLDGRSPLDASPSGPAHPGNV